MSEQQSLFQSGLTGKLKRHKTRGKRITDDTPSMCRFCGKPFKSIPKLICHTRTHTGEKPHKCKLCDKAFACIDTLADHMRFHTGDKQKIL